MLVMGLASFASDLTMPISWDACVEIGGPYCATVAAAMNMLGNLGGFVAPVVGGIILAHTATADWNLVIGSHGRGGRWCRLRAGSISIRKRRGANAN